MICDLYFVQNLDSKKNAVGIPARVWPDVASLPRECESYSKVLLKKLISEITTIHHIYMAFLKRTSSIP